MSGYNALMAPNLNALQRMADNAPKPAPAPAPAPAQQAPPLQQPVTPDQFHHLVSGTMRGQTQDQMVQRREAAGAELDMLSKVMSDPDPKPDAVKDYMLTLMKGGQIPAGEAIQILKSMPDDPDALRSWARTMFNVVAHIGVHAHSAFPKSLFPAEEQVQGGEETDA